MKKYNLFEEYKDVVEFFMIQRYYCTFLKRAILMYDEPQLEKMTDAYDYIVRKYGNYYNNKYFYILSADARFRMKMNEISSKVCAQWEISGGNEFNQNNGIYKEMYKKFYYKYKDKIISIVRDKNIILYGDPQKKNAFVDFFGKMDF